MEDYKCQLCGVTLKGYYLGSEYRSTNSVKLKNGIYCHGSCEEHALRKLEDNFNSPPISISFYILLLIFILFIINEFNINISYEIPEYYNKYIKNITKITTEYM